MCILLYDDFGARYHALINESHCEGLWGTFDETHWEPRLPHPEELWPDPEEDIGPDLLRRPIRDAKSRACGKNLGT